LALILCIFRAGKPIHSRHPSGFPSIIANLS
jgi:hypothetical protein